MALLLLLIVALAGLGTGALAQAQRQALAARAGERTLQGVLAAESGARSVVRDWPAFTTQLALGAAAPLPGSDLGLTGRVAGRVRRTDRELFMVELEGRHALGSARGRLATALWALEGVSRLAAQGAAVVHGGGLITGSSDAVSGAEPHSVPLGWPTETCAAHAAVIDSLFPTGNVPTEAPLPTGSESAWTTDGRLRPFDPRPSGGSVGLGLLPVDSLVAAAGALTSPMAPATTVCDESSGVEPPACSRAPGLLGARGDPVVSSGSGAGVLVVAGSLTLEGDLSFAGWILVSGDVTLRGGARVDGFVRAGGSVEISEAARLFASPCAALEALHAPWLTAPRVVPGGARLTPLP